MKRSTVIKHLVVEANSGAEFERLLDEAVDSVKDKNPRTEFNMNRPEHCAYVSYEETTVEPENVKEEYELRGIHRYCSDCPFFDKPTDGRIKYFECDRVGREVHINNPACLYFYQLLADGKIGGEK